ncbi:Protein-serine/threonine phosphatase protein [Dioscorea alata]|uniref:Protein-serine/threonine phosphatase protein n=1 Tax=Dioscorea alata TaxID=55571 RepID=A0ACB7VXD0_DIOAL|nr:Protein-serine/threonine phosphatase protein [Dioscorea alata]
MAVAKKEKRMVPLEVLLKRELWRETMEEQPDILYGVVCQPKKGEDFTLVNTQCRRFPGDPFFSVFALFDGHEGCAAAIYSKENLLDNILSAIPKNLSREQWLAALPRALVSGFVKTDKEFLDRAQHSGTTVTFVIIDGWVVTIASVGDSLCILESAEGSVHYLSEDHRLEFNNKEVERLIASGVQVRRLHTVGGTEVGPLRCWPGGLSVSRTIGDRNASTAIVPIPHVKQIKLSNAGGRIIISSDGVWDSLTTEMVLNISCGLPAVKAATEIVEEVVHLKGLRDDTTCIVVDILPPEKLSPSVAPSMKQRMVTFKSVFFKKSCDSSSKYHRELSEPDLVEEIFEDGSAVLAQRLSTTNCPMQYMFNQFICAVCQIEMKPGEGTFINNVGSSKQKRFRPWNEPLLCRVCLAKKEAMEGKIINCISS